MIKKSEEFIKEPRTGNWEGNLIRFLPGDHFKDITLFGKAFVRPGHFIPLHKHDGSSETFYILKGTARATDNEIESILTSGDLLFTGDGDYHSIQNIGNDDLEFITLVVRS